MDSKIADIRQDYKKYSLSKKNVHKNPVVQFESWLQDAIDHQLPEPTAMIISTAENNRPSSRTVLLKGVEQGKFLFFTNYDSRKGQHLKNNPYISATFLWKEMERQIHIEGQIAKAPEKVSDDYFNSRPWKSRIGARISPQSQVIKNRNKIKLWFAKEAFLSAGKEVKRPENWGGFYIIPDRIEFWQGRPSRLHDRILFTLEKDNSWNIERLAP